MFPVLAAAAASGCGAAAFQADGFHPQGENYSIRYRQAPVGKPGPDAILGRDWRAVNLYANHGKWDVKQSDEYWEWVEYDTTGDGVGDKRIRERVYGLELKHRVSGARIWISTVPLPADDAQTDLGVLLRRFSSELSRGVQLHRARFKGQDGAKETHRSTVETRYAARTLGERACSVSGQVAHSADIEIANVDQLEIDPTAARKRAHIVFVRPPYDRTLKFHTSHFIETPRREIPIVHLVAYLTEKRAFSEHTEDFSQFLRNLDIRRFYPYG